ncbi:MAG: ABC transporter permease [Bryobacteraceae bacterium]|jgi:predicted permease
MLRDLCQALRALRRVPSLTVVSILTVALGVGAGVSLFSVVKAVLLNPLPYPEADRLAWIAESSDGFPRPVAYPNFEDWNAQNRSFSAMGAYGMDDVNTGGDRPQRTFAASITPGFFDVLGVQPAFGRTFLASEQIAGAPLRVILGYGLWQRAYGGDPKIVGRALRIGGYPVTVIGVMPLGFSYPPKTEIWLSVTAAGYATPSRTAHNFRVIGRLRPGVTFAQAQSDVGAIQHRLYLREPGAFMSKDASVVSLDAHTVGKVRPALLVLFGAVGFLLLIVCVNVANLLLVRVTARARELAVRRALGAGHTRLFGQMLTESLLLALAGGAAGLLLALWSMDLLKALLPAEVPRAADIRIDMGVMLFALAITAAAGVLFGLLPAWRAARMNMNEAIKGGSRTYTAGRRSHRTQSALVVSEVCLSLVLLAGAGLLVNSFVRLRAVDPGFRADHVLTATLSFASTGDDKEAPRLRAEYASLLTRVRAIPGVQAAGTTDTPPLGDCCSDGSFKLEGRKLPDDADAVYTVISSGYLRALRIPLVSGRDFTDADTTASQGVAIITAEMARRYWAGRNPLGDHVMFDSMEEHARWLTIVGVAADVRQSSLIEPPMPQAYVCYTQANRLLLPALMIRTPLDPASLAGAVRAAIGAVDREIAIDFKTMDAQIAEAVARQRFQMQVLGGFAALALLLAAVGLYGVLSYLVAAGRGEIGIRMALGAQPLSVFRMIAGRALRLSAIGAALGLAGCLAMRPIVAALLFGVGPSDPVTLAAATAALLAVAFAASAFPALRAMRIDPASALREE